MLYEKIAGREEKLAVIGMGYVGMPIAIEFANHGVDVIGFDINQSKIEQYKSGIDPTGEIGNDILRNSDVSFTSREKMLAKAKFYIVAVPTPINQDKTPDLSPVIEASRILGKNLSKGSIVVYESTVYPGVTESICMKVLEEESGLKCGKDFYIGYSPERINPGDKIHKLKNIKKIVSGMDKTVLEEIARVYGIVIEAGVFKVSSIKVAEAAKVVENSQRDVNIAFMNELAMVFDKMGIDTNEVVDAMNTKWNALGFRPGLVGGHCIGVDPYYLVYEAECLGYSSQIIAAGRKVNDGMARFVADAIIKQLVLTGKSVKNARVVILGITFKENCPDIRNSKVADMINCLKQYGIEPDVVDPLADYEETKKVYGLNIRKPESINDADCLVFAVSHEQYKNLTTDEIEKMTGHGEKVIIDIKGIVNKKEVLDRGYRYWSL